MEDNFMRNAFIGLAALILIGVLGCIFLVRTVNAEWERNEKDCATYGGTLHAGGKYADDFCVTDDGRIVKFY